MRILYRRLASLVVVGALALSAPAAASATSTPEQIATARANGVTYLKGLQNETTGAIPGFGGDWSLTAFAAAGVAPAEVNKGGKTGTDARSWYEKEVGAASWPGGSPPATEFERAALIGYAAGIDPARIGQRQNLIARVASYYQPASAGYYGAVFNETVFGLLAMASTKTTTGAARVPQVLLEPSIAAVLANQHTDGGWTYAKVAGNEAAEKGASDPDMTGAAMASLCSSGIPNTNEAIVRAKAYLASIFLPESGAFAYPGGVNTDTVAWAVDGLKACGIDPQAEPFNSKMFSKTPIDFLRSQQVAGGGFRYATSGTTAGAYASQDAVRALGTGGFTAAPPKPSGGPQWTGATTFATGKTETATLALIVNDGVHPLKVCSVTVTPKETTTTLKTVLTAAVAGTTPSGCVTNFAGTSAITQISSYPATPEPRWYISIDGGAEAQALTTTAIHVGDTLYLKFK